MSAFVLRLQEHAYCFKMIAVKTFLFNVLCALVPCDPSYDVPEVDSSNQVRNSVGGSVFNEPPITWTRNGPVRGYFMQSSNGNTIVAYEGIPYAEPPINELRFQSTLRKGKWQSVLDATAIGPQCLQVNPQKLFRVVGQEDCLYMNIYTPKLPAPEPSENENFSRSRRSADALVPVIIWIHGGGFMFGSGGEYGPAYILNEAVILVTFNYRLGVLGFASTGDLVSPGNYGLKDQALAIEWVHDNIASFGGDPGKVTLMGQSAGAVSVHLHMLSKRTRNLFRSAVSISGTAFSHWSIRSSTDARQLTLQTAKIFNCAESQVTEPDMNSTEVMNCLKRQNSAFLVAAQMSLFDWLPFPPVLFAPVLEDQNTPDYFIASSPAELYTRHEVAHIPWITSMTSMEGHTVFLVTDAIFRTNKTLHNWHELASTVLDYKQRIPNGNQAETIAQKIAEFYFRENETIGRKRNELSDIFTDRYFTLGFHKALQYHSEIAPTYAYFFDYLGKYNLGSTVGSATEEWGVGHAEDVFFLFNSSLTFPGFKKTDQESELSSIMVNLIYNFVNTNTSEPVYTKGGDGHGLRIWNEVNKNDETPFFQVLQLKQDIRMIDEPFQKRIRFWEDLEREYNLS